MKLDVNQNVELAVLNVQRKEFINKETGETFSYYRYYVTLNGKDVNLYPTKEDKKYFNLLAENRLEEIGY